MSLVTGRLEELGITLPNPVAPIANYVGFVRTGNLLFCRVSFASSMEFRSPGANSARRLPPKPVRPRPAFAGSTFWPR
jgi:hypothetical protein